MENHIDYKKLGMRIRKFRIEKHMNQEELSEVINCNPSLISHVERGTTQLALKTLVNLCNALEVTLDQVLCDSVVKMEESQIDADFQEILKDCNTKEKRILRDILRASKTSLRENR